MFNQNLMREVRDRFHHVDSCPFTGTRIFFENAGGALTLKSVAATSARLCAVPDNQGRDNPASRALVELIDQGKASMRAFLGIDTGHVFVGESGSELLFRLIRSAVVGSEAGGMVMGSSLEHPASSSAAQYWAAHTERPYTQVLHNSDTGTVTADDYRPHIRSDTRVATIIHTSPVTGMSVDVAAIAAQIRSVAPSCLIVVDGIQHAAHGGLALDEYQVDGYAISPYKVFSRHGYGVAWASDRLTGMAHERLKGAPLTQWELGTRDTAAYATFTDVVDYLDWLGSQFTNATDRRMRILAAGVAIGQHEEALMHAMVFGSGSQRGLAAMSRVRIIGGEKNPCREGLVSLTVDHVRSVDVVEHLADLGIRVHVRKDDHYSGNILIPLGLNSCVRVSLCHYNTIAEVEEFLRALEQLPGGVD